MKEEEVRQMMATMEYYRAQLEGLAEQHQIIHLSLEESIRAKETLKQYQSAGDEAEILVPVGGNSFVHAKVASSEKVLVGLGSGVTVEKSADEALNIVEVRIKGLAETIKKISERRGVLEAEHAKLNQRFQEAYQKLQQGL
ncbi:MAG TPA: prefoldin subunit alpha [Methanomassiliicoccales archaeon]|nr:prefoldin subunit alpha [Methanomassiliicoccales archaeon]